MKKVYLFFAAFACSAGVAVAQPVLTKLKSASIKLPTNSTLKWYAGALLKTSTASSTNGTTVLATRNVGGNRVDLGIGLPQAAQSFTTNGAVRQTSSGDQVCTIQPMKVDFLSSDNLNLFTSENNILPGQFYNINSILNNSFSSFQSPQRKEYQLGMSIFNPNNPAPNFLTVTNLSRSPLPEVQSVLLAPNYGASIPAEGVLDIVNINSDVELKASFSASEGIFLPLEEFDIPADITAGIKGESSGSTATSLKYYMLNFYQPMYTINVLTNHNELFADANAFRSCTNGAYVESVTYGRRIIMILGSAESETKVKSAFSGALSASITGGDAEGVQLGGRGSTESDASLRAIAQKFHAKIYGGEGRFGNALFSDIITFKNALKNYLTTASASTFSAQTGAVPLHYTLRRISDNSLLSVRSVGSYDDLVSCNTATYKVEVLWKGFKVNSVVEAPFDDKEDIWGKLTLPSATIDGSNVDVNKTIKNIARDNAISLKAGESDADDVTVLVLSGKKLSEITNTTLNFAEAIYDWEPLHNPEYKPNSSAELKFNLADHATPIRNLQPGQSVTFDNNIDLTETGPVGSSKITLFTKIKVTKL